MTQYKPAGSVGAASIKRRLAQAVALSKSSQRMEFAQRLARRAYHSTGAITLEQTLPPKYAVDSADVRWPRPGVRPSRGRILNIAWLTTAPSPGSGGHTTLFRMIEGLESAGHQCTLYLYDPHNSPVSFHESVIRRHWPTVKSEIRDVRKGVASADGFVATSWQSAHILGSKAGLPGARFYFVQDYEPYFYPHGSEYALAEDTYRFGYHTIAIGGMIAETLKSEHGVIADRIQFGCDTQTYTRTNLGNRNGIVFYAKPSVARRGYLLGMAALERFHDIRPEHEIHLFGDVRSKTPFPSTIHGTVSPKRLAELYNRVVAGLAMSFTNISLVPYEMLACGAIPIVNETAHARAELTHPEVLWARPTPSALVNELTRAVTSSGLEGSSARAAEGIKAQNWRSSQETLVRIIEDEIYAY